MVFVGNGFDIAVLKKYGKGITTSYDSFYYFYKYKFSGRKNNQLISQMKQAKDNNKTNWSDFEAILTERLQSISLESNKEINKLDEDLNEIQREFSKFLNDVIDGEIITKLSRATEILKKMNINDKTVEMDYPIRTLSTFIADLPEEQFDNMKFNNRIHNYDIMEYKIINFNYTSLLDNYIYLDKNRFNPEPHISSYNNFTFYTNPNNFENHKSNNYVDPYINLSPIDVIHPHGFQDVPKSLLFGTEIECENARDPRRTFKKSFWARCAERYDSLFVETELFIIYGCSLGTSDSWWWRKIYNKLVEQNPAELIIYNYGDEEPEVIKNRFIYGCCIEENNNETLEMVKNNIYVINFGPKTNNTVVFLDLPDIN